MSGCICAVGLAGRFFLTTAGAVTWARIAWVSTLSWGRTFSWCAARDESFTEYFHIQLIRIIS